MPLHTIEAPTEDVLYERVAEKIAKDIKESLASRGSCFLGIVGGHTEPGLLSSLAPRLKGLHGRIDVFWLDERIEGEKNYLPAIRHMERMRGAMVEVYWHPIKSTDPDRAEEEADRTLQHMDKLGRKREFDIVILSSGEDCHIASLFPHSKALNEKEKKYVLVDNSPKPPRMRVSVSPPLLLSAKRGYLFFVGDKQKSYIHFLDPLKTVRECPEKLLTKLPDLTLALCLKK